MKKWIAVAVVVVFSTAGILFARYHEPRPMSPDHGFRASSYPMIGQTFLNLLDNDDIMSRLKITQDQSDHLRQIIVGAEEASIKNRAQAEADGLELREMLRAEHPDQGAVMKKVQQISDARSQMMKDNIKALLQAKQVLSPEQQKQIRDLMRHRAAGWMWGPDHFRHGHAGPGAHSPGPQAPSTPAAPTPNPPPSS